MSSWFSPITKHFKSVFTAALLPNVWIVRDITLEGPVHNFPKATNTKQQQILTIQYHIKRVLCVFPVQRKYLHTYKVPAVSFCIANVQSMLKFKTGEWKIDLRLVLRC